MIQDIYPIKLNNEFRNVAISQEDPIFIFNKEGKMLLGGEGDICFPMGKDVKFDSSIYLFAIVFNPSAH